MILIFIMIQIIILILILILILICPRGGVRRPAQSAGPMAEGARPYKYIYIYIYVYIFLICLYTYVCIYSDILILLRVADPQNRHPKRGDPTIKSLNSYF